MGQMYIVNAPMLFTGVWAIVKGFLDEKTRQKIHIKGHKYEKDLLELVDAENLPDFLGGKCKCEEFGGGCMFSNAGPWNDYEIVHPVGIKRKQLTFLNEVSDGSSRNMEEEEEKNSNHQH